METSSSGLPAARNLRCSVTTAASDVQGRGATVKGIASLDAVQPCSMDMSAQCRTHHLWATAAFSIDAEKQGWWYSASKTFEPVARFWLEAKELTHLSLQGDTALGRNNQKTMHSH